MKTKYICIEGGDGTGKSTLIKNLKKKLEENGKKVLVVAEPSTPQLQLTKTLREIALNPENDFDQISRDLIFQACRNLIHTKVVKPAIGQYDYILQDRGLMSSFAYLLANKQDYRHSQMLANFIYNKRLSEVYDSIILIDNSSHESKKRINNRKSEKDVFDSKPEEFFDSVKDNMLKLSLFFKEVYVSSNEGKTEKMFCDEIEDYLSHLD